MSWPLAAAFISIRDCEVRFWASSDAEKLVGGRLPANIPADELADTFKTVQCCISVEMMDDPVVVLQTGQVYDRASIEEWFESTDRCIDPLTGVAVTNQQTLPHFTLQKLIGEWRTRCAD